MPMLHEMSESELAKKARETSESFDPNCCKACKWALRELTDEIYDRSVRKGQQLGKEVCEGKI